MKKIINYILITIFCYVLIGCSIENGEMEPYAIVTEQTKWERQKLDENLVVDLNVENSEIDVAYSYICNRTAIPVEDIQKTFFYGDTSQMVYSKHLETPEEPKFGYVYSGTSQNGLKITSSYLGSVSRTNEAEMYRHFLGWGSEVRDADGEPNNLGTAEELSFLDKKTIQEEIEEGLNKLIPYVDIREINFYTLTSEYLDKLQKVALKEIKNYNDPIWYEEEKKYEKVWEYEEGAYYVTVEMSMDGIAISDYINDMLANETRLGGYTATFIYNKNGCIYADLPMLLNFEQSQDSSVISVAQALEVLKKDITSVILTNENVIEDAKLQYVLVYVNSSTKLEILPMWIFEGKVSIETNKGDLGVMDFHEYYFVNAITGEVLR